MPQKASFPDNLTGSQVLELISDIRSATTDLDFQLIDELSFRDELHKSVKTLSGGTRQKISAAIAFAFQPKILFLDEPTAGLDPVSCGILKDKIIQEASEGTTVVLTSHILSDVDELAANLVYLLNGTIIFHGTVEELKSQTGDEKLDRAIATLTLQIQEGEKLVGDAS
jgi:Cu-processing system ATP-binding protein